MTPYSLFMHIFVLQIAKEKKKWKIKQTRILTVAKAENS